MTLLTVPVGGQGTGWWREPAIQGALHLTTEQTATIERLYAGTLRERQALRLNLDRAEKALDDALRRGILTDAGAGPLITRVADARRRRNIARVSLLLKMYRALTPSQRQQLSTLHAPTLTANSSH
jgi:Spy/CpxP family protein refolding chaperone